MNSVQILENVNELRNLVNNSEFTSNEKLYLYGKYEQCRKAQCLHQASSYYYQKWSYAFTIPLLILNSVMAITIQKEDEIKGASTSAVITFILNSILIGIKEFFKFDKRVQFHIQQYAAYGKLANQIETKLVSTGKNEDFNLISNQYVALLEDHESLVPDHIAKNIQEQFCNDISPEYPLFRENTVKVSPNKIEDTKIDIEMGITEIVSSIETTSNAS